MIHQTNQAAAVPDPTSALRSLRLRRQYHCFAHWIEEGATEAEAWAWARQESSRWMQRRMWVSDTPDPRR